MVVETLARLNRAEMSPQNVLVEQHEDIDLPERLRLSGPVTASLVHIERKNPDNSALERIHVH